jgi:hypothetical protein
MSPLAVALIGTLASGAALLVLSTLARLRRAPASNGRRR